MDILIKETGKLEKLSLIDDNGIDWTEDFLDSPDELGHDGENYTMTKEAYEWWQDYIDDYIDAQAQLSDYCEKTGIVDQDLYDNGSIFFNDRREEPTAIRAFLEVG